MDTSSSLDYSSFLGESSGRRSNGSRRSATNKTLLRAMLQKRRVKVVMVISLACLAVAVTALLSLYFHASWLSTLKDDAANVVGSYKFSSKNATPNTHKSTVDRPGSIFEWSEEDLHEEFLTFKDEHKKSYDSDKEHIKRFQIFKKNLYYIHTHNEQGFSYTLKMNHLGDLTREEFKARHTGYRRNLQSNSKSLGVDMSLLDVNEEDLPASLDWREKGCVTEVKDQEQCGSCWAFSATGSLEGATCAQLGKFVDLSEQQLVDCAKKEGNMGCNGGEMDGAFQYVMDNNGLCGEHSYPYHAKQGKCHSANCSNVISVKGFKDVPRDSELALKTALHLHGPVSVAIEADQTPFQFYHRGVFSSDCGNMLDHGVLVIGYGTDENTGMDFWAVKNSWGSQWGDHGFIRLARHKTKTGECGILMTPSYPIIESVLQAQSA